MSDLAPGTARMTHPDPTVEDAIAKAEQVPHLEHAGWRFVEGDREHWPEELQRFDGETQVYIRHPVTGASSIVPEIAVPHWRAVGWQVVDPDAEQAAELEGKKVAELRELAKDRGISPIPPTKDELIAALEQHDTPTDSTDSQEQPEAGDEPAPDSKE